MTSSGGREILWTCIIDSECSLTSPIQHSMHYRATFHESLSQSRLFSSLLWTVVRWDRGAFYVGHVPPFLFKFGSVSLLPPQLGLIWWKLIPGTSFCKYYIGTIIRGLDFICTLCMLWLKSPRVMTIGMNWKYFEFRDATHIQFYSTPPKRETLLSVKVWCKCIQMSL